MEAAPAPVVGAATALDGGFRFTVESGSYATNTAAGTSYSVTTTAGAVIDDGDGIFRVVGLANGESAIATITATRPGFVTRTTSVTASALALGVAAQIESITGTRDGFTFTIANFSPEASYTITSSNVNANITRASGAAVVTVTGLANLEMATLAVKTSRPGFMDATTEVTGVALPKSEVNSLAAISLSNGAIAFSETVYEYTINVSNSVATYRVTPTKSDVDSTMTISINGAASTSILSGAQSNALTLNVGENTIVIAVTSQVGSVQTYTLYVKRAKSSVATLGSISFSAGTVTGFDSSLTSYELSVPYGTSIGGSNFTATASPTSSAATMEIKVNSGVFVPLTAASASAALALNVGNNLVTIQVTAEDGLAVTTYEFTVTREGAQNSQLGALSINVGTMPTFSSSTLNYEVIVPV
ncbi:MAG: hypothetical protein EBX92_09760, partial [Actinobacteria bacterium]|nr:hypothetical protein [Actinomycetota bacterium]